MTQRTPKTRRPRYYYFNTLGSAGAFAKDKNQKARKRKEGKRWIAKRNVTGGYTVYALHKDG